MWILITWLLCSHTKCRWKAKEKFCGWYIKPQKPKIYMINLTHLTYKATNSRPCVYISNGSL
uniref:Uncharacterized protein n=1 Tax=Manihot esculenta TaxID=3983 RepID=A0A2C9W448_MANES